MDTYMNQPTVSVIMPVYNGAKYLREAINSLLDQMFTDFELIILNDGSIDQSEEVILSYNDPRIRYVKNEVNLKLVRTLNKGIQLARGLYIARMDQDDICLPQRFEKQIEFMDNNLDIDVCGSWIEYFGSSNHVLELPQYHDDIKSFLLHNSPIAHPSVMIRKEFFETHMYDPKYEYAEDYALWASAIDSHKFYNIPKVLLKYRIHDQQMGSVYTQKQEKVLAKIRANLLQNIDSSLKYEDIKFVCEPELMNTDNLENIDNTITLLCKTNKKSGYFKEHALEAHFSKLYFQILAHMTHDGFKTILKYHKSEASKYLPLSFTDYIKFIIKCIIK